MKTARKNVVVALSEKVKPKTAEKYEKAIFDLAAKSGDVKETYPQIAYEKAGQLISAESEDARERIMQDIWENILGWDSCVFKEQNQKYERMMEGSIQKPKATKGIHKCHAKITAGNETRICGSDEFYVWTAQLRSCDEPADLFRQCAYCNTRGKN